MIYVEVQMRDIYNPRDERSGRTSPPGRAASVAGASVMKLLPSVGDHSRLVRQPHLSLPYRILFLPSPELFLP